MLLHQNKHFIYNHRVAFALPNNVYIDPSPDPCPIEGMVLHSEDLRTTITINFIETEKDAKAFLEESIESFDKFEFLKAISAVQVNGLKGYMLSYSLSDETYEEYVFAVPRDTPALLNICLEQQKGRPTEEETYAQVRDEILSGLTLI